MNTEVITNSQATLANRPTEFGTTVTLYKYSSKLFYLLVTLLLFWGWQNRHDSNLTAETGLGYLLGIVGGSLMLLLLFYPLRKKFRFMHHLGAVKYWFKMHMLFGVLGPVAILFHCNFSLGSVNSNLALWSMVIVASSGLVGRYLYAKIHDGLYGRKTSVKELREELALSRGKIGNEFNLSDKIRNKIRKLEAYYKPNRNLLLAFIMWPWVYLRFKMIKSSVKRSIYSDLAKQGKVSGWDRSMRHALQQKAYRSLRVYIDQLYSVYGFSLFQKLFSLWHLLHLPLFVMLVITGILHVVVVHGY